VNIQWDEVLRLVAAVVIGAGLGFLVCSLLTMSRILALEEIIGTLYRKLVQLNKEDR